MCGEESPGIQTIYLVCRGSSEMEPRIRSS